MADPKTETVGYLSKDKLTKLKGWSNYAKVSKALKDARDEAERAKSAIRDELKHSLGESGNIDFVDDGERIRVFRNLQPKGRRARVVELTLR